MVYTRVGGILWCIYPGGRHTLVYISLYARVGAPCCIPPYMPWVGAPCCTHPGYTLVYTTNTGMFDTGNDTLSRGVKKERPLPGGKEALPPPE